MVYRLTVAYRGTAYSGWQRQPNGVTVQQRLEEALEAVVGHPVSVVGAGRTDAGVHARGQVAHLELERSDAERMLVHGANHHLEEDIRVLAASRAADGFHARKAARSKEYRYRTVRAAVLSPMDSWWSIAVPEDLDVDALADATARLAGRHDFTAFALAGGSHRSPVRRIHRAAWIEQGPVLELSIVGDGFLRGMVRGIVGTLLEVGRGRRQPRSLDRLLAGAARGAAGPTAPPQGLVLERVSYAEDGERPVVT